MTKIWDIARVGFFGDKYEFEVYIVTDDECQIPHFHIRDALRMGILDAPVRLDNNQYIHHGKSKDKLQDYTLLLLADFMAQPCRNPHYENNYEYAVDLWNMNNAKVYDYRSEDLEAEKRRKKQQWRACEKAIAELQGFDISDFDDYYREQDEKEQQ